MRDAQIRPLLAATAAALAVLAAGCSRDESLGCAEDLRYLESRSVPPLRVPDDLTVPDETEALRVPDAPAAAQVPAEGGCIETPPDFFGDQEAPG